MTCKKELCMHLGSNHCNIAGLRGDYVKRDINCNQKCTTRALQIGSNRFTQSLYTRSYNALFFGINILQ